MQATRLKKGTKAASLFTLSLDCHLECLLGPKTCRLVREGLGSLGIVSCGQDTQLELTSHV